jgi:autotransporter-associated beta strand protein
MKTERNTKRQPAHQSVASNLFVLSAIALVMALISPPAFAANRTWSGAPADQNWSNGGNWGGTGPAANVDAVIFNDSAITNLNDDLGVNYSLTGITFNTTTNSSYVVTNNAITLNGGITDNSSQPQTLNVSLLMTNGNKTISIVPGGNLIIGGVIGNYPLAGQNNALILSQSIVAPNQFPSGAGISYPAPATLTLNSATASTYTNTTTLNAGTVLALDFANMATPVNLLSTNAVLLNGATYSLKGKSSGTTVQTNAAVGTITFGTGGSIVTLNPNGGTSTTLKWGNTWTRNSPATLNVDISAGGTLFANPALGNGMLGFATVKDSTGTGFATTNSSGAIVRYTATTALDSAANSTVTNYSVAGSLTMGGSSFGVNSLTLDASGGNGVWDLGGAGVVMTNNQKGILMVGANNFTVKNGQLAPAGTEIIIHQMGSGILTNSATIGATSSFLTKNGNGTLILSGSSTNTGTSVINRGTVMLGISSAPGSGPFGNTTNGLTINAGGTLDLNGNNLTVGTFNANGVGVVTNSAGGAPAVIALGNGNNRITGYGSTYFSGNVALKIIGNNGTRDDFGNLGNAHTGGTTYVGNNLADRVVNPTVFGSGPLTFGGTGGFQIASSGLTGWNNGNFSNAVVVNGTGNLVGWQTSVFSSGAWTGAGTLTISPSFTVTINFAGDISGFQGTLLMLAPGNVANTGTYNLSYVNPVSNIGGSSQAVFDLQSVSTDPVILTTTSTNSVIRLGDLNTAGNAGSGAITLRNNLANTTNTFEVGALNLSSTYAGVISDGVVGGAIAALTKVGTGTWTLTGSEAYSGPTTVSNGILVVNGSLNGNQQAAAQVNVYAPGAIGGSGSVAGPVILNAGSAGISLTNNTGSTLTLSGGLTLNNGNVLSFDLGTASDQISVSGGFTMSGTTTINLAAIGGFGLGTYTLISGASITSTNGFVLGSTPSGYVCTLVSDGANLQVQVATSIPAAAFWDNHVSTVWNAHTGSTYNWDTDASSGINASNAPGTPTDVTFAASGANNFNTTLGADFSIHSLNFTVPNNVTIGGANTLTLNGGVTVNSGAGANTISAGSVVLGVDQPWNVVDSGSTLTVSSPVSGAHALTLSGSGTVLLSNTNTYSGGTIIFGGTLTLGNPTNTLADTGAVNVNGGTLNIGNNSDTVGAVTLTSGAIIGTNGVLTGSSFNVQSGNISANLTGTGSTMTMNNAGNTVVLSGTNSYTGNTTLTAGTLVLAGNNSAATGNITDNDTLQLFGSPTAVSASSVITLNTTKTIQLRADKSTTFTAGGINAGVVANFNVDEATGAGVSGSTLTMNSPLTWTASGTTLNADGGTSYNLGLGDLFGGNGGNATLNANSANLTIHSFTGLGNSSAIVFAGPDNIAVTGGVTNTPTKGLGLVFNQTGTVTLWGAESLTGSGPVTGSAFTLNSGKVVVNNSGAISAIRGNVTLGLITGTGGDSGATLMLGGTDVNGLTGGISMVKNILVEDGGATPNIGPMIIGGQNNSGTNTYTGSITLGATANTGFSATLLASTGGEVDVIGGVLKNGTDTTAGITVGDSTHAGVVKLLGANTYGGLTTVSNGTLVISTSHSGGGNFAVADGNTFGVTNAQNAASATMANLTLGASGPTTNRFDNVASTTIPIINATGALAVNGNSKIIITTNNAINAAGEYPLIKYGSLSGNFTLATTPTNFVAVLTNDVSNSWIALSVLSVYSPVNTNATNITASVSGGNLTMSWPTDHTGWRLQAQTNSLNTGLGTNWANVAGSATTNQVVVPIVTTNGAVFYRLVYP